MEKDKLFITYTNCIPVKGYSGSIICDLQRNKYDYIPNDLFNIIIKFNSKKTVSEIKNEYNNQYDDIITEYFEFLLENDYINFCEDPNLFPEISLDFYYPFEISNCIIDLKFAKNDLLQLVDQLNEFNCKFLEIRDFGSNYESIIEIVNYITNKEYIIKSINITFKYNNEFSEEFVKVLMLKIRRLSIVTIYESPINKIINLTNESLGILIYSTKKNIDETNCGITSLLYFSTNIKNFTESLHHNSCLHKKISIDSEGNIRNCPSMPQSFGNIKDTSLEEALNYKDFKKYWNLTKDKIEVCKDCEFRYICTDCRAYTERTHENAKGLDTSKPLKCGYNPYTGEWEEWSTNPLKQKAIKYYGMQELIKKN